MDTVEIQRVPLSTSPSSRINSYNRHAFAPWIKETGYLTPRYLSNLKRERLPFNMGRWMTQSIASYMLRPPLAIIDLHQELVEKLLRIAACCQYSALAARRHADELAELADLATGFRPLPACTSGYFIRLSESSPKDVDNGDLRPVHSMAEAFQKLVCSKRAVQALLTVHHTRSDIDNSLYFFPFHEALDKLSEWRCFVHENRVVAISQSRFYQPYHSGVGDELLRGLVFRVRGLWRKIYHEVIFSSCTLDVYAELHKPNRDVKLIEINPYFGDLGSGSLLFHWVDDEAILLSKNVTNVTIVRLVDSESETGKAPLGRAEAYEIGREGIIQDELEVLERRGLQWILKPEYHDRYMKLEVPAEQGGMFVTRRAGLERFGEAGLRESNTSKAVDHPRVRKLQEAYMRKYVL